VLELRLRRAASSGFSLAPFFAICDLSQMRLAPYDSGQLTCGATLPVAAVSRRFREQSAAIRPVYAARNAGRHLSGEGACDRAGAVARVWRVHPWSACAREIHAGVCGYVSIAEECVSYDLRSAKG
jgi:hypothetical protein